VQPWSLAEFQRTAYQDFAGVQYVEGNDVILQPNLPASWGQTEVYFRVGDGMVRASMRQRGEELSVSLVPEGRLPRNGRLRVRGFGQEMHVPLVQDGPEGLLPADSVNVTLSNGSAALNGEAVQAHATYALPDGDFWADFSWTEPQMRDRYPVMQALEEERRLTAEQVSRVNPTATVIATRTDPAGDDFGVSATYTYPTSYPPGILDIRYLEIAEDRDAFYFRIETTALANPEDFGFQPTFFALALNTEEGGETQVGRGSNFRFPSSNAYNYIVFIGDGLRVEDDRGRVLGEFAGVGEDIIHVDQALVEFALPKFVLPAIPRGSQITLLVGGNEGGQPGRFRPVVSQATSQLGGGKVQPRDPNIYDIVSARVGG